MNHKTFFPGCINELVIRSVIHRVLNANQGNYLLHRNGDISTNV
jgi:hypothetical protein